MMKTRVSHSPAGQAGLQQECRSQVKPGSQFRKDGSGQREERHRHKHSCDIDQAASKDVNHHPSKGKLPIALLTTSVFSQWSDPWLHGCTIANLVLSIGSQTLRRVQTHFRLSESLHFILTEKIHNDCTSRNISLFFQAFLISFIPETLHLRSYKKDHR